MTSDEPDPETAYLADGPDTQCARLAWSLDEDDLFPGATKKPDGRRSWGVVCGLAAALLSIGMLVAVTVGIFGYHRESFQGHPGKLWWPAGAAAPPRTDLKVVDRAPPANVPLATAPLAAHGDPDQLFINELRRDGIAITDEPGAIGGAKLTCSYLAAGHPPAAAVELVRRRNPTLTVQNAEVYVDATIRAYCPQYGSGEHGP